MSVIGDAAGHAAIIADDFNVSGGTPIEAAEELRRCGARSVVAAITHAVFACGTASHLEASPTQRLFVTDTIETQPEPLGPRIEVLSVGPLCAEAIRNPPPGEHIEPLHGRRGRQRGR